MTNKAVDALVDALKTKTHLIPGVNLTEAECYDAGLFRGAIERIRGQYSAAMADKRNFAKLILNKLEDEKFIAGWSSAGGANRYDYSVVIPSGRNVVVELKGCLDGNNTNIFERPLHAQEFYIWILCTNAVADPVRNAWSGIHTRLGAEIIDKRKQVDGLLIWDMVCGTIGRPCPKLVQDPSRAIEVGPHALPPPCVYMFPSTIAAPRNNPTPQPYKLQDLEFMSAVYNCFGANEMDLYSVFFEAQNRGADLQRRTRIEQCGATVRESPWTTIRRS